MKTYWIVDGSYALADKGGEMGPTDGNALFSRKFSVLASGCDLPANNIPHIDLQRNNVIAIDTDSGQIVFTQWKFLRKIEHCPRCGYIVNERN